MTGAHPFRWLFLGGLVGATTAAGGILYVQRPLASDPPAQLAENASTTQRWCLAMSLTSVRLQLSGVALRID